MDIGSLFLVLALMLLVGLFVGQPFLSRKKPLGGMTGESAGHEISALLAERDRLINALQELDFDHALGKIPADEYPAQRAVLLQQGSEVLRALDELTGERAAAPVANAGEQDDAEERLEAVIAARRADARRAEAVPARPVAAAAGGNGEVIRAHTGDDELEQALAARRRTRQERSGGFCSQCGGAVQKSDRFCPKCGNVLD